MPCGEPFTREFPKPNPSWAALSTSPVHLLSVNKPQRAYYDDRRSQGEATPHRTLFNKISEDAEELKLLAPRSILPRYAITPVCNYVSMQILRSSSELSKRAAHAASQLASKSLRKRFTTGDEILSDAYCLRIPTNGDRTPIQTYERAI